MFSPVTVHLADDAWLMTSRMMDSFSMLMFAPVNSSKCRMNGSVAACFSGCGVVALTDFTLARTLSHEPSFSIIIRVDFPVWVRPENAIPGSISCCLNFSRLFQ